MRTIAAIGETHQLEGFALVGVTVVVAATRTEILRAWRDLDPDVGLVILSPTAAEALVQNLGDRPNTLTVVTP